MEVEDWKSRIGRRGLEGEKSLEKYGEAGDV